MSDVLTKLQQWRLDPTRWARDVYKIRDKKQRIVPFVLKPAQRDLAEREAAQLARQGFVRQYILKARQGGFTTYEQMRSLHLIWSRPNIDALTIADKLDRTQKIYKITDRAISHLPPQLTPELGKRRAMGVNFPKMDSEFYTDTAGSADPARGLTLGRLHGSEFAHWDSPQDVLSACMPSVVTTGAIVLETTASMLDDEAHKFWVAAEQGESNYEAIFYPWWECDEDYRLPLVEPDELGDLSDEERRLMARAPLTLEHIKWRRSQMRDLTRPFFLREYAEDSDSCWKSAGDLLYDAEQLKKLLELAPKGDTVRDPNLTLYRPLRTGCRMIIGVDVAEGGGGDKSAWCAMEFESWDPISRYASPNITPELLADKLHAYARENGYPILVIEKNAHGITVIRRLRDVHHYPIARLYHRLTFSQANARPTRELGWYTGEGTKPLMIDGMREWLNMYRPMPHWVVRDCFRLRYDKNGNIEFTGRDDFVAGALAWEGRKYPYIPLGAQLPPTMMQHA